MTSDSSQPASPAELMASTLSEADLDPNPHRQLECWLREARAAEVDDWNAMTLATIDSEGGPAARIVLLKGLDERGIRFFTNYESDKGRQLTAEPRTAAVLFWPTLGRQIRVTGCATPLSSNESDEYYASRPLESRLGAWASPQSRPLASREELESTLEATRERFRNGAPDRPPHWGGFLLEPTSFEFWKSRPFRLHDRFRFTRSGDAWVNQRLAP